MLSAFYHDFGRPTDCSSKSALRDLKNGTLNRKVRLLWSLSRAAQDGARRRCSVKCYDCAPSAPRVAKSLEHLRCLPMVQTKIAATWSRNISRMQARANSCLAAATRTHWWYVKMKPAIENHTPTGTSLVRSNGHCPGIGCTSGGRHRTRSTCNDAGHQRENIKDRSNAIMITKIIHSTEVNSWAPSSRRAIA